MGTQSHRSTGCHPEQGAPHDSGTARLGKIESLRSGGGGLRASRRIPGGRTVLRRVPSAPVYRGGCLMHAVRAEEASHGSDAFRQCGQLSRERTLSRFACRPHPGRMPRFGGAAPARNLARNARKNRRRIRPARRCGQRARSARASSPAERCPGRQRQPSRSPARRPLGARIRRRRERRAGCPAGGASSRGPADCRRRRAGRGNRPKVHGPAAP